MPNYYSYTAVADGYSVLSLVEGRPVRALFSA